MDLNEPNDCSLQEGNYFRYFFPLKIGKEEKGGPTKAGQIKGETIHK